MPDVPNLPGVPTLTSYSGSLPSLIFGDGVGALISLLAPAWGIYIAGSPIIAPAGIFGEATEVLSTIANVAALVGIPNIVPVSASTIEFDYSADSPISTYPQEDGAFQSYNKVQLPFDVKLRLAKSGTDSQRQAFFNTLEALRTSTVLVDIVTPEKVFASCNCKHVDWRRTGHRGVELIVADAWFEQVRVISAASFSNTLSPANAGPQGLGNVQPQQPSAAISQQFAGIGSVPY